MLVFGKALAEHEAALAVDQVVLVRGRVDHKEAGKTCLIVQTVEVFAPSEQEIARGRKRAETRPPSTAVTLAQPVHVRVDAREPVRERDRGPQAARRGLSRAAPRWCSRSTLPPACAAAPGRGVPRAAHADAARRAGAACFACRRPRSREALRRLTSHAERYASASCAAAPCPARAASSPARLPRAWGLRGSRRASPARTAAPAAAGPRGTRRSPRSPSSPSPMFAWRSRFEPSGVWESLRCSEPHAATARACACDSRSTERPCRRSCGCHSRRRAGGRSPGTPPGARPRRRPRAAPASSSNERPSVPPAPAVFSRCSGQPSLSASASRDRLSGARDRLADVAGLGRAGVQHHARGADRLAHAQRVRQRGERFGADVGVLAGAVEQVDGVDQHRVDRAVGHRLAERREVLLAVGGRAPHARRLVEDLDRAAAALHAALDRLRQAARGRDVRSD